MPSRRPTRAPRRDFRPNWTLLPDRDKWGIRPMVLCRPGFSITTTEEIEVASWARRFPDHFAEALIAFKEANIA